MRGQRTLTSIFRTSVTTDPDNKGKRNLFQERRNQALICRYYYHIHLKRCRYDDALMKLQGEFFLSASSIIMLLSNRSENLKEVVSKEPALHELRKDFPLFLW